MKTYKLNQEVNFKGKAVKVIQIKTNYPDGKRTYLLGNGATVTAKDLEPKEKTNFKQLSKTVKKFAPKARKMQIEKPIDLESDSNKNEKE